jgi:hypothetical protein
LGFSPYLLPLTSEKENEERRRRRWGKAVYGGSS